MPLMFYDSLIKPENIRIYRRTDGIYTIRPEGRYVPWLSHFDRLISLTVSIYPSWAEAKEHIESTWQVALPEKIPIYLDLTSHELPKTNFIPGLTRITITAEDLKYLGLHLCTVGIVGFNSSQKGEREKIGYEDLLPKMSPPIHHQILSALDGFCKKLGEPIQAKNYRDGYGDFYTRFWWNGNGVEVVLANLNIEEERRGTGLLKEIIDHLKLDSRVHRICVEQVGPQGLKQHLRMLGFHEDQSWPSNFILSRSESWK
jgi:hypothetical protein